jgi:NitT/TauT family transport system substrate-binding protein
VRSPGREIYIEGGDQLEETRVVMNNQRSRDLTRRKFLRGLSLGGAAAFFGLQTAADAAEQPLETSTIRLIYPWTPKSVGSTPVCTAPFIVAEELLHGERFAEIRYVQKDPGVPAFKALASGEGDLSIGVTVGFITQVDAGARIIILTGVHVGCYELFATGMVRSIRDLKGKTVAIPGVGSGAHLLLAAMAAYVGLDPIKDIRYVMHPFAESIRLLANGEIDGFMAWPPEPQELRAKKIGHVIVNTITDRPWSRYFCCSIAGNREFVRKNPVATKRVFRAILKSNDICAREPERAARILVKNGYTNRLDYALESVKQIPYGRWRNHDPEDTVRFYSLRLHEVGMIKSSPQKIIAQGTNWGILRELKRELKA